MQIPENVTVVRHPLVQHKLTLMRQKDRSTSSFRSLLNETSELLAYETTRDLPLVYQEIETPLARMQAPLLEGKKVVLVAILRAGLGLVEGMLRVLPSARVGHIGIYRDPETLGAVEYYMKLPSELHDRDVIVTDPLLATGNSAVAAISRVKSANPKSIKFVCLIASPEGLTHFHEVHPDVPIFLASVDEHLDEHGYIVPGLGDAGNRLYGTR
ncbi:MAG TPA: uracil phosphoribosyltransferase [Polyangiaceae bacterium]|nr:uracil phosphoribosyltransferase [Polyangiaceae bacterium]